MKAVVFPEPNRIVIEDRPIPEIGDADAQVKVHACGVCGTDLHIFHGEHIVKFPVVPGHEFSGEVVKIGDKVKNISVGDRVTVDPNIVDHTCRFCRRGEINLCENLTAVGVNFDGGFAEYCRVPAEQLYRVPPNVSLDEAAMAEPLACCIHGIDRAQIKSGDTVVVLGAGTVGLMMVQLACIAGAGQVIVSEPDEKNRILAAGFGSDVQIDPIHDDVVAEVMKLTGVGADVVIECAGRLETAQIAPKLARRGGTILQFGVVSPDKTMEITPYDIFNKELTIRGSFVNPYTHARAVELLASKRIDVMSLITHRFPLEKAADALDIFSRRDSIKILIMPGE